MNELLTDKKIPKAIRYAILLVLVGFLEFVSIGVALSSPYVVGRIFGWILAAVILLAGVYIAIVKIYRR